VRPSLIAAPLLGILLLGAASPAHSQTLDPRSFVNTPVGLNFIVAGYAYSWGNVAFDPSVSIENADLTTQGGVAGLARAMNWWGLSGKLNVGGGFICANGSGDVQGVRETRDICGLTDLSTAASVNFIGAPAISLSEYPKYQQRFLMGASLAVTAPTGQYDETKLVNIGTHRWSFRPQIGMSQSMGRITLEFLGAVTLYTRNGAFFNGHQRDQAPLYSGQVNLIYTFRSGIWGAIGGTVYGGGRVTTDGTPAQEIQENWRVGGTLVFPVSRHNSFKLWGTSGLYARTGGNFHTLAASWVYAWGGRKAPLHHLEPAAAPTAPAATR
jgi:hypothetical protein